MNTAGTKVKRKRKPLSPSACPVCGAKTTYHRIGDDVVKSCTKCDYEESK